METGFNETLFSKQKGYLDIKFQPHIEELINISKKENRFCGIFAHKDNLIIDEKIILNAQSKVVVSEVSSIYSLNTNSVYLLVINNSNLISISLKIVDLINDKLIIRTPTKGQYRQIPIGNITRIFEVLTTV